MVNPESSVTRLVARVACVALLLATAMSAMLSPRSIGAQQEAGEGGVLVEATVDALPLTPSFVRLIRITMEPGSSVPRRTHPGPKLDRVESGAMIAVVEGPGATVISADGESSEVAENEEIELGVGDAIAIPMETIYEFRNEGDEPTVTLTNVILPAGHQRPDGIGYPDGEPPADAYAGVTNQILGDGVATEFPASPAIVVIEELSVEPGGTISAVDAPNLLSLGSRSLDILAEAGRVQVSRTLSPGPQQDAEPGTAFTLISGDALFFPAGNEEISVPESTEELTFLRLVVMPSDASEGEQGEEATESTPVPPAEGPAVVTIAGEQNGGRPERTGRNDEGTPVAPGDTQASADDPADDVVSTDDDPAADADEPVEPADEPETDGQITGTIAIGSTVETVDLGVNVRAEPSIAGEIVSTIEVAGERFVIIGPPVEADGFVWYPVQGLADPTLSGWIAVDFLVVV